MSLLRLPLTWRILKDPPHAPNFSSARASSASLTSEFLQKTASVMLDWSRQPCATAEQRHIGVIRHATQGERHTSGQMLQHVRQSCFVEFRQLLRENAVNTLLDAVAGVTL
jgi:hypothetical protein